MHHKRTPLSTTEAHLYLITVSCLSHAFISTYNCFGCPCCSSLEQKRNTTGVHTSTWFIPTARQVFNSKVTAVTMKPVWHILRYLAFIYVKYENPLFLQPFTIEESFCFYFLSSIVTNDKCTPASSHNPKTWQKAETDLSPNQILLIVVYFSLKSMCKL